MSEDDLEQRLRRLGAEPLDPQIERTHRLAIAEVIDQDDGRRWRFGWKAVGAAAIAGFLVGSTGLAAAGTLPGPAQDVAHEVLGAVGINVPRSTEGCPEGTTYRNHGEYVSAVEAAGGDVEAAAHSDCGMPLRGNGNGNGNGNRGTPRPDTDGDPCTGPPPWAGAHLTRAEREAAQAERRSLCGATEDDQSEVPEAEAVPEPEQQPDRPPIVEETTTTSPPETTTSTSVDESTTSTTTG